jgi:hypothetical protein
VLGYGYDDNGSLVISLFIFCKQEWGAAADKGRTKRGSLEECKDKEDLGF